MLKPSWGRIARTLCFLPALLTPGRARVAWELFKQVTKAWWDGSLPLSSKGISPCLSCPMAEEATLALLAWQNVQPLGWWPCTVPTQPGLLVLLPATCPGKQLAGFWHYWGAPKLLPHYLLPLFQGPFLLCCCICPSLPPLLHLLMPWLLSWGQWIAELTFAVTAGSDSALC